MDFEDHCTSGIGPNVTILFLVKPLRFPIIKLVCRRIIGCSLLQASLVNVFEHYPPPPPPPPPEPVEEPSPPAQPPIHYETKFPFVPPDVQIFYEPTSPVQMPILQVHVPTAEPRPYVQPYDVQKLEEHAETMERVPSVTEEEMKAVSGHQHYHCYTVHTQGWFYGGARAPRPPIRGLPHCHRK